MKRISSILALSLFFGSLSFAQSLNQSLGAVKTNFKIYSDSLDLGIIDQQIILRAKFEKQEATVVTPNSSDMPIRGLASGYQSQHLELITKKAIVVKAYNRVSKRKEGAPKKYQMIFYDADGSMLVQCFRKIEDVNYAFNSSIENSLYFYSIDLIDVPLIILDKTSMINIVLLDEDAE